LVVVFAAAAERDPRETLERHWCSNGSSLPTRSTTLSQPSRIRLQSAVTEIRHSTGIIALTQQAPVEYAPHGIRVNAIAPGRIMTPLNERIFATAPDPQRLIASYRMHALGRFGQPNEVASAIVVLASEDSSFVTGECLRVDGGLVIKGPTGD
jgi:hypothetical protein